MGLCNYCLGVCGATTIAVLAVLSYFHMECINESHQSNPVTRPPFLPNMTDISEVPMSFCEPGQEEFSLDIGLEYMLIQWSPCAVMKLHTFLSGGEQTNDRKPDFHNVTIHDARKHDFGDFHQTGFTLIELEKESETTDWRSSIYFDKDADVAKFHREMEPHIKELYPGVKRIRWPVYSLVRGGGKLGDQEPAVGAPHLDNHQDDAARLEFHDEFPAVPSTEATLIMGEEDDEDSKLGVILGVWKPIHPKAVCDRPLAVMDARTFDPEDQTKMRLHRNFGFFTLHSLIGAISYSPKQKWAYYSFQTTREVLVFHQYSKNRFFANPHSAFINNNCPQDSETRVSVEMRVGLFF